MSRNSYGPGDRQLLESLAKELYARAVADGALKPDDPSLQDDGALRAAAELLLDIGLLRVDEGDGLIHPVDPTTVQISFRERLKNKQHVAISCVGIVVQQAAIEEFARIFALQVHEQIPQCPPHRPGTL